MKHHGERGNTDREPFTKFISGKLISDGNNLLKINLNHSLNTNFLQFFHLLFRLNVQFMLC